MVFILAVDILVSSRHVQALHLPIPSDCKLQVLAWHISSKNLHELLCAFARQLAQVLLG